MSSLADYLDQLRVQSRDQLRLLLEVKAGDQLIAIDSVKLSDPPDDPFGLFTADWHYLVIGVHPKANPPYVVVLDDAGREFEISPNFLPDFWHVPSSNA